MPRAAEIEVSAPTAPAERAAAALAFLTVAVTTWGWAGRASWAPAFFGAAAVITAGVVLVLTRLEGLRVSRTAFAPFLLFAGLVGASLLNPSFVPVEGAEGTWRPREGFIAWLPGTVDRASTLAAALPWGAALLLGGALRQAAIGRSAARRLLGALLAHGLVVALVGAFFYFTDPGRALGLVRGPSGYHFVSFGYRNHWAAYVLVLLPVSLGFAFSALRRWRAGRVRMDALVPGLAGAGLLAITLPMPGSRSGTVLAALLLLVALALTGRAVWRGPGRRAERGGRRVAMTLGLACCAAAVLAAGLAINRSAVEKHWRRTQVQWRAASEGGENLRLRLSRDTLRMAAERPIWGWGAGSYRLVFPSRYQGDYLRDGQGVITTRVVHAHNDWAQVAAELGLVGLLVLAWPAGVLLVRGLRDESPLARWAAVGVGVVALYAWADFPLHCPAVLLLWVTVLGVAAPAKLPPAGRSGASNDRLTTGATGGARPVLPDGCK
jgi:O-antigen ligase